MKNKSANIQKNKQVMILFPLPICYQMFLVDKQSQSPLKKNRKMDIKIQ
jgi:hypothetical protein